MRQQRLQNLSTRPDTKTFPRLTSSFKIFVLDTFAAALIGSPLPWAKTVLELVHELGGSREATVINQSWKTDISRAALANGTMIGSFECQPLTDRTPLARFSLRFSPSANASIWMVRAFDRSYLGGGSVSPDRSNSGGSRNGTRIS